MFGQVFWYTTRSDITYQVFGLPSENQIKKIVALLPFSLVSQEVFPFPFWDLVFRLWDLFFQQFSINLW